MRCRLCGHEFDPEGMACHAACPLGNRCTLICCPNCGYQVVDESKSLVARTLDRLWPGRAATPGRPTAATGGIPLSHVPVAHDVRVRSLEGMPPGRLSRLIAFGLAPGTTVRVLQRRPVPVLRVGETDLALSDEILGQIRVEPPEVA